MVCYSAQGTICGQSTPMASVIIQKSEVKSFESHTKTASSARICKRKFHGPFNLMKNYFITCYELSDIVATTSEIGGKEVLFAYCQVHKGFDKGHSWFKIFYIV